MMIDTKKIKRIAFGLGGLACIALLGEAVVAIRGLITWGTRMYTSFLVEWIVTLLIVFVFLAIASIFLFSIKKNETPFILKNVKRLKAMGLLFIVKQPIEYIFSLITMKIYYPDAKWSFFGVIYEEIYDGITYTVTTSLPSIVGFIFVAGLVIYGIALVYEYGISLQEQADETL